MTDLDDLPTDAELDRLREALSDKQRVFCERYLANGMNAREAAEYAGYGDPIANACRIKAAPSVTAYIDYRLEQMTMSANEVLARLNQRASYNIEDLFDFVERVYVPPAKDGEEEKPEKIKGRYEYRKDDSTFVERVPVFNAEKAREAGVLHLVEGFEYSKNGDLIVKLPNKGEAVALIGKHKKLFTDRVELSTDFDFSSATDEELERLAGRKSGG